jgi:PadR family transcriptional regulator PadR
LVEAIRERTAGEFDLPEGTVYPSLYRLERRGLVTSRWEQVAGRRRRVYRLTSAGKRSLETQRAEWRSFASAVESVLA